ncbi:hypothetical protein Peur_012418 [Populus x canadensis]
MLRPNASLGAALSLLAQANVSSIPIVNDNDSLLDVYSRRLKPTVTEVCCFLDSDITALAKDKAYAQIHLDEISIHQALQLGQNANSSNAFYNGQIWVRRLLIVEAGSERVEGVISLSDVFRFLLGI